MSDKPDYLYETYIRTTPERLWEAITSAEFTRRYFHGMEIRSDWKVGAAVTFHYPDGKAGVGGELLEYDPPRRLAYTWRFLFDEALAAEAPSRVTYEIEPRGATCLLRVIHDRFPAGSKVLPMISEGWAPILCSLKSLLETGEPLDVAGNEEQAA